MLISSFQKGKTGNNLFSLPQLAATRSSLFDWVTPGRPVVGDQHKEKANKPFMHGKGMYIFGE